MQHQPQITNIALEVLRLCSSGSGFLASNEATHNYKRVWSRDAMIAGIATSLGGHQEFREEFLQSIITLVHMQAPNGQIPSNVTLSDPRQCSYGSLSGRVDATTWWLCGVGVYALCYGVSDVEHLRPNVHSAFSVLKSWEMNQRGLLFTPPGGNWADEYIVQGYTLYDQCLRIWAMHMLSHVYEEEIWKDEAQKCSELVKVNFGNRASDGQYHSVGFAKWSVWNKPYMAAQFDASGYSSFWDAAGNALALVLRLNNQVSDTASFVNHINQLNELKLTPAFYPTIHEGDAEWDKLVSHYAYAFKNYPGDFHNGGIWPVWCGWLAFGFAMNGHDAMANSIQIKLSELLENASASDFKEFWNSKTGRAGGVNTMAFTASGWLLADLSVSNKMNHIKNMLTW